MQQSYTLLVLAAFTSVALPADPRKLDPTEAGNKYGTAIQQTAKLLEGVKDEATAEEAKPKLENLWQEARDARKQLFMALAEFEGRDEELAESMLVFWKKCQQFNDSIVAEFDRIGNNHKAAYKVLRVMKPFAELEKQYESKAAAKANHLTMYAKTYQARTGGKVPMLADLADYAEDGQRALSDPWGFPYQMLTKPGNDGVVRTYCWTVSPYSGKKLGQPPPEEK